MKRSYLNSRTWISTGHWWLFVSLLVIFACGNSPGKRGDTSGAAGDGGAGGETSEPMEGGAGGAAGEAGSAGTPGTSATSKVPKHVCASARLDPTTATSFYDAARCLFEGAQAPQKAVTPGTITAERVAILRGRVLGSNAKGLSGVTITVDRHPEFGTTTSDSQGYYAMAVNGGELLTLQYSKSERLPIERQRRTDWQRFTVYPDVVLLPQSTTATLVELERVTEPVFASGAEASDSSGSRTQAVLVRPATQVTLTLPDGSTKELTAFHLRSTEYTVGAQGPSAMPGDLPTTSGYTYAAELSLDEARAVGATRVTFDPPVISYVDNFLEFPAGTTVPAGYYDPDRNAWVSGDSGLVVKILSIDGASVTLDVTGDELADGDEDLIALGIDEQELQTLARQYKAGTSLWRVPLAHFSPWDFNWGFGPPPDAELPNPDVEGANSDDCQTTAQGSIIGCESQALGEKLPIFGTPVSLHYQSERMPGRRDSSSLAIKLSGASLPTSVKSIELEVEVLGKVTKRSYSPVPNLVDYFDWDGKDVFSRTWQGRQHATVSVGYVYDGSYERTNRFGSPPSGAVITGSRTRQDVTLWRKWEGFVGSLNASPLGLGGWTLDVHHLYDPRSKTLYLGDGTKRSADSIGCTVTTVAGTGTEGYSGDQGPAVKAELTQPHGVVVAPDGTTYLSDDSNHVIRRVSSNGIITTIAGTGTSGFAGDGGPATAAQFTAPMGLALAPDGTLYIADADNGRVRAIDPDGTIRTFAGGGTLAPSATNAIPGADAKMTRPHSLALAIDGRLLVADDEDMFLYAISPDGMVTVVAGGGGSTADGAFALETNIETPVGIAISPSGEIYFAEWDGHRVRRIDNTGRVWTVAGTGTSGSSGDGGPGVLAALSRPHTVELGPEGSVYITDEGNRRIRQVSPDGYIRTIAGTGESSGIDVGDNGPPLSATFTQPRIVYRHKDGSLWIGDYTDGRVRRIRPSLPGYSEGETALAASDAREVYIFDSRGRHLRTVDALTQVPLWTFGYDESGKLLSITDGSGNQTQISRDPTGLPTALLGPYGAQTKLGLLSNGYLGSVQDPLGRTTALTYGDGGLLKTLTEPDNGFNGIHEFTYDEVGRLTKDESPSGLVQTLTRKPLDKGTEVALATGLGRTRLHRVVPGEDGSYTRTIVGIDGTTSSTRVTSNQSAFTSASGTTVIQTLSGDPRFGLQAPIAESVEIQSGALPKASITRSRAVEMTDPSAPTTLTHLFDTVTVNGRASSTEYDVTERRAIVSSPMGRTQSIFWDALGRVTTTQIGGLAPVAYTYDSRGRIQTATIGTRSTSYTYGDNGHLRTATDPLGHVVTYATDAIGRRVGVTLPDQRSLVFAFDAHDNPQSLSTPGQTTHRFAYFPGDLVESYVTPVVGTAALVTTYGYNSDQQLTTVTAPDATKLALQYGAKSGQLLSVALPGSEGTLAVSYDEKTGQLKSETFGSETVALGYKGELVSTVTYSGPVAGSIALDYDANRWVTSLKVGSAAAVTFEHDDDGLLTRAGDETLIRHVEHDAVTGTSLAEISDSYSYSSYGELSHHEATIGTSTLYSQNILRDVNGRITELTETVGAESHVFAFTYHARGWLESVKRDGAAFASYNYDANGNRTSTTKSGTTTAATFDAVDRITTFGTNRYGYNGNGNLSTKETSIGTTAYQYNALGALSKVTLPSGVVITYQLDGSGRRLGKSVNGTLTRGLLYVDRLRPVAELDGAGKVVSQFVYATHATTPDYLIRAGKNYRIISDSRGSVRLVVDATTGSIAQRLDYDAFGQVTMDTNPGFQPFGFAGGLYDADTKLVRFGARDYDPEIGRWTNRDPILFGGGQSNLYVYVGNDPVNFVDPMGTIFKLAHRVFKGISLSRRLGMQGALRALKSGEGVWASTRREAVQLAQKQSSTCGQGGETIIHDAGTARNGGKVVQHAHGVDTAGKDLPGHIWFGDLKSFAFGVLDSDDDGEFTQVDFVDLFNPIFWESTSDFVDDGII